jgi:hypothetical protein
LSIIEGPLPSGALHARSRSAIQGAPRVKNNVDAPGAPWKKARMPKRGNRSKKKVKNRSKNKRKTLKRTRVRRRRALRR